MPKKRFSAEQIVVVLRQIEVLMSQGKAAPVACREAGISQQTTRRMPQRRDLLQPKGSHRRHRAMAQALQHDPAALIAELPASCTANFVARNTPSGSEPLDAVASVPLVQNIRQVIGLIQSPRPDPPKTEFSKTRREILGETRHRSGVWPRPRLRHARYSRGIAAFPMAFRPIRQRPRNFFKLPKVQTHLRYSR
jgi:hypothetical protein